MRASELSGEYPRPQLVRREWAALDGPWQFAYDDDDVGVRDGWFEPASAGAYDRTIEVPYPPESPASGIGDTGFHPVVWYRRELSPADLLGSDQAPAGTRLLIHFGAVDYEADVWIDGVHSRRHVGGQSPFEVDVTDALALRPGPHVLVVRAKDDPVDPAQPRGKQDWELEPHGIWYDRTTGIWQPVWSELVPSQRIVDIAWTPRPDEHRVDAEIVLAHAPAAPVQLSIRAVVGEELLAESTEVTSEVSTRVSLNLPQLADPVVRGRLSWSPEQPALVDAQVSLQSPDVSSAPPLDTVASYFGIVTVSCSDGAFLLNSSPYYVRAVLAQNYWPETHLASPDTDALRREIELAKSLGFNTVRVHQKAEDPRFLFHADRLGVLVWGETANALRYSATGAERLTDEWSDIVRRDRSHPCIAAWVPINESWGVPEIAVDAEQQDFARRLAALTREIDSTRPVLSNEGWEHVDSDILGVHDYGSDPVELYRRYRDDEAVLATLDGPGPQGRRLVLTDEQRAAYLRGDAPFMMTEFGGVSFASDDTWGYQTVGNDEEFASTLRGLFAAVQSSPVVAGFCFTQLTDTRQEANGLLTAAREPKLSIDALSQIVVGPPAKAPRRPVVSAAARAAWTQLKRPLRRLRGAGRRLTRRAAR
jgi:beta-galactosidase/beta-glucuronidase